MAVRISPIPAMDCDTLPKDDVSEMLASLLTSVTIPPISSLAFPAKLPFLKAPRSNKLAKPSIIPPIPVTEVPAF